MKSLMYIIVCLAVLFHAFQLVADTNPENKFKAADPVLLTSAGQSADILMAKILAQKAGLDFVLDKTADEQNLDSVSSVIIVTGGSTKGLGAAKIDKEDEYKRVESVLVAAKEKKKPVIVMHLGGKSRRGALSDYFNKLSAEHADYLIVVKGGDEDGFFAAIAKEKSIKLELTDKIINVQKILENIYGKNKDSEE